MFFEISKSGVLGLEVSLPGAKKEKKKKKLLFVSNLINKCFYLKLERIERFHVA